MRIYLNERMINGSRRYGERNERIQVGPKSTFYGLLRRFAPRNDGIGQACSDTKISGLDPRTLRLS